jgi:hypothetical protein
VKLRKRWFGAASATFAVALVWSFTANTNTGGAPAVRDTITVSVLTQGNAVVGTSQATASITPTADCLVVAAVQSSLGTIPDQPTASGNGLTYTAIESFLLNGDARRITVFEAMGAAPSAGAITFDWGAEDQTSAVWAVLQFCGVDQTDPIIQETTNTAVNTLTIDGTLAALEHANNVGVAIYGIDLGTVVTGDGDWDDRTNQTQATGAQRLLSETTAAQQLVASPTAAAQVDWGIVMLEVRSGGGDDIAGLDLAQPWERHTMVAGVTGAGNFDGADGVDMGTIAGSQVAAVSGSEQGGKAVIALEPTAGSETGLWNHVILPTDTVTGPEDAILADVDLDGTKDIVLGLEGGRRITILFAPTNPGDYLTAAAWTRVDVNASTTEGHRVMRVAAADLDGDTDIDLIAGAKENDSPSEESYIRVYSSATPRSAASWTGADVTQVGWVKQMLALDMDEDDDIDIVWSDGSQVNFPSTTTAFAGIWWAENNGAASFTVHEIVGSELAWEWFSVVDWNTDGELDVVGCRSNASFSDSSLWLSSSGGTVWTEQVVTQPANTGECQHATAVDIDLDGDLDLAFSYNHADPNLSGLVWLRRSGTAALPAFQRGEIAGTADGTGIKFDNIVWTDVNGDGFPDAVTSEQHEPDATGPGLGLIWYENPNV